MQVLLRPARIDINELAKYISLSKSEIYCKLNNKNEKYDEDFPKPIKYGNKNIFLLTEVDEWIKKDTLKSRRAG